MTTVTDTLHENTHNDEHHVPSKGRLFYLGRYRLVFCVVVELLATVGWILGYFERVSPAIIASSLLLGLAAMLGWPFAILLSVWPQISLTRRLALLAGLVLCIVGLVDYWSRIADEYAHSGHASWTPMVDTFPVWLVLGAGVRQNAPRTTRVAPQIAPLSVSRSRQEALETDTNMPNG